MHPIAKKDVQSLVFLNAVEDQLVDRDERMQELALDSSMLTKGNCCTPSPRCFSLPSSVASFVPTGPIVPVTGNFFYAYGQIPGASPLTTTSTPIPFSGVGITDGSWSWSSITPASFVAQVEGVYLVTVLMSYYHIVGLLDPQTPVYLFLEPFLGATVVPFASVFYFDNIPTTTDYSPSFQVEANFIIPVTVGQVLQFQDSISDPNVITIFHGPLTGGTSSFDASVSIVRIK